MVYVDNFQGRYGRMIMCHMIADTRQELLEMADRIGVERKWIQEYGTRREHFDISQTKKKLAIENGAVEINMRRLASMTASRDFESYANPDPECLHNPLDRDVDEYKNQICGICDKIMKTAEELYGDDELESNPSGTFFW